MYSQQNTLPELQDPKWVLDTVIETYIFDLDGTLYDFGGGTFSESRLGIQVRKRYHEIIDMHQLGDPELLYETMVQREWNEKIGISQQIAGLLKKTRTEVLRDIWGAIDPQRVIQNYEYAQEVVPHLRGQKDRFLVTAAPRVWATKALTHMRLSNCFNGIFTLEDYGSSKKEPFSRIQSITKSHPRNIISIGDQEYSDILPARELGMTTLHVSGPQDLYKLIV